MKRLKRRQAQKPENEVSNMRSKAEQTTKLKFSFTPGPWEVYDSAIKNVQQGGIFIVSGLEVLAEVPRWIDGRKGEHMANARLIAAAPEMLEALQDLLDLTESYGVGQNSAIVDRASAAVAKAEGGSR